MFIFSVPGGFAVNSQRILCRTFAFSASLLTSAPCYAVVTWEQQAERLQNVSATLLDNVPLGDPVTSHFSIEGRALVSFLPKVDPTVGGKKEKVPSSPVHAVPTLQLNSTLYSGKPLSLAGQVWGGYLMPGAESLFGIKAKLSQVAAGGAGVIGYNLGAGEVFANIGVQYAKAELTGAITATNADDRFDATTLYYYVAPGYRITAVNIWFNFLIGAKRTQSEFNIKSDNTKVKLSDSLKDSSWPFASQVAVGWRHPSGFQVAASELVVPKRVTMPRVLVSYEYSFK